MFQNINYTRLELPDTFADIDHTAILMRFFNHMSLGFDQYSLLIIFLAIFGYSWLCIFFWGYCKNLVLFDKIIKKFKKNVLNQCHFHREYLVQKPVCANSIAS